MTRKIPATERRNDREEELGGSNAHNGEYIWTLREGESMDAATIWETLLRIRDEERGIYAEYDVTIIHAGGRKDQRQV